MVTKRSFASLKPKDDKKASHDVMDPKVDVKKITEEAFETAGVEETNYVQRVKDYYKAEESKPFNPTSPRLMAVFELLTNKSFPRKKGKGKSTKIVMLDAIIVAAIDKKLILQEEEDAKSRGS